MMAFAYTLLVVFIMTLCAAIAPILGMSPTLGVFIAWLGLSLTVVYILHKAHS